MTRSQPDTDLLCTVPDFLGEAALAASGGFAADPLPFDSPAMPRVEIRLSRTPSGGDVW